MKFSVIIPAYNVADYIEDCVKSVLQQSYSDFEVIIVDDGSTDNRTPQMVDSLGGMDSRIRIIHQENSGLSEARNSGISIAQGEYLLFLDGDDFWSEKDFLLKLSETISKNQAECFIFSYHFYYSKNDHKKISFNQLQQGILLVDKLELVQEGALLTPAWNKCVARSKFSKELLFPKGLFFEDGLWCAKVLKYIDTYCYIDLPAVMYRQNRSGSITNRVTEEKVLDSFKVLDLGLIDYNQRPSSEKPALDAYFSNSYISILPFVYPYISNPQVWANLKKYKYLLKYSNGLSNKSFRLVSLFTKLFGLRVSLFMLHHAYTLLKNKG